MNLLITGSSGKLGRHLVKVFPHACAPTHDELDITETTLVVEYIRSKSIDAIIHAAAIADVRTCEENRELAYKTNVQGTRNLVLGLEKGRFIYVSTACVFSGEQSESYFEDDVPYPKHFYGLTKLLGEVVVRSYADAVDGFMPLIVRTNFVQRSKWKYPKAFVDRYGTFLYADQVASAIRGLLEKGVSGLVHICGDRPMSMYDLARITDPDVSPLTLNEYVGPPLTVNMCLSSKVIPPIHFS